MVTYRGNLTLLRRFVSPIPDLFSSSSLQSSPCRGFIRVISLERGQRAFFFSPFLNRITSANPMGIADGVSPFDLAHRAPFHLGGFRQLSNPVRYCRTGL